MSYELILYGPKSHGRMIQLNVHIFVIGIDLQLELKR
jgi:hypothetical protein